MYTVTIIHGGFEVEYVSDVVNGECERVGDRRYAKVFRDQREAEAVARLYRLANNVGREGKNRCFVALATGETGKGWRPWDKR